MASRHFPQHITVSTSNLPDGFDVEHQLFKHHAIRSPSNPFDLQSRPVKHINGINPSHPLAKSETVNTQPKSNPATSNLEGIAIFRSLPVPKANATASTAIFRSLLVPKQMRPLAGHHRPSFCSTAIFRSLPVQNRCGHRRINLPFYNSVFPSPVPKRMRPLAEHQQPSISNTIFSSQMPKRIRPLAEHH